MFTVPTVETFSHPMPDMSVKHAAEAYEELETESTVTILYSYAALAVVLFRQYNEMVRQGLKVEFRPGDAYQTSREMMADVAEGHIFVRQTFADDYADLEQGHPMSYSYQASDGKWLVLNDVFRAVHDVYGHFNASAGFGPDGEALAWLTHRSTMPFDALPALWCETRGQNAWTNFYGADLPIKDRPFASQKFGLVSVSLI